MARLFFCLKPPGAARGAGYRGFFFCFRVCYLLITYSCLPYTAPYICCIQILAVMCIDLNKPFTLNRYDNEEDRRKDFARFVFIILYYCIQFLLFIIYLIIQL